MLKKARNCKFSTAPVFPQCCLDDFVGRVSAMKRIGIRWLCLVAVVGGVILLPAQTQPPSTSRSDAVFKQLKSLVGEWEAVQDGVPVAETYTLTANGSALMAETKPAKEPAMITMITVDGDHLIATHYCAARNQPQMETGFPDDLQKGVTFSLVRVTGMRTPEDYHNTGLTIILDDRDHMTQRWTYLYKRKPGTTIFHYTRTK
jgi:hypothetical protein